MAYCGENTAVKYEGSNRVALSVKCRSWCCQDCEPKRRRALIAQGMGGSPTTFLTLTYKVRQGKTPNQAALELSRAWRLVRLRLMRKYKLQKLPFLAVMEKTKAGWPHIHILLRTRYLDYRLIRAWMEEIAESPVIHIEKIANKKKAAGYCVKYCSKATEKFDTAKRYWQSRDYDLRDPEDDPQHGKVKGGWELNPKTLKVMATGWESIGGKVEWLSAEKCILWEIDWKSHANPEYAEPGG